MTVRLRLDRVRRRLPTAPATAYDDDDDDDDFEPERRAGGPADAAPATRRGRQLTPDVYVVDGRPRYHLRGCVHLLGRESEPLPVSEAVELGFTPCGVCEPDSRSAGRRPPRVRARAVGFADLLAVARQWGMATIAIRVKPGASRTTVGGAYDGPYGPARVVAVNAPPSTGGPPRPPSGPSPTRSGCGRLG